VFLVPINGIRLTLGKEFMIHYRTTNLMKFDAVLTRIPKEFYTFAYQLLSLFPPDTYMPIKPISFLVTEERFFMMSVLRKRNIPTIDINLARSSKAIQFILENANYPLLLRVPGNDIGVVVETQKEAKSIVETIESLKSPVIVEEIIKDLVSLYVVGNEVVVAVRKKSEEKDLVFGKGKIKKEGNIDAEVKYIATDTANAIDTQIARIDITTIPQPRVVNIELNPALIDVSKVCKVDIAKRIIDTIYTGYLKNKEKPLLVKFFEDAKSVVKEVLKNSKILI